MKQPPVRSLCQSRPARPRLTGSRALACGVAVSALWSCGAAESSSAGDAAASLSGPTFSVSPAGAGQANSDGPQDTSAGSTRTDAPANDSNSAAGEVVYSVEEFEAVENFDRQPGMPIGPDEAADDEGPDSTATLDPTTANPSEGGTNEDLEIPTFTLEQEPPPCTDCLQLSVLLDSPNQQAFFSFNAGGQATSRVVWNLVIPANEDQIFLRTRVNGTDGPYEQLLANDFPTVGQPFEYVHRQGGGPWSGNADEVGLVLGSSGGWARNERVSVYVQSVVLEGSNGDSDLTADNQFDGLITRSTEQQPQVQLVR